MTYIWPFFKGGTFVKWLNTKSTNSFLSSILLLFIFQCCFLHFVNLLLDDDNPVENRQEPGIQAGVLRAQAATNFAKEVCPYTLCPIWTSLQAISPRVANSLLAFPSDEILPTNRYNQPCINNFPFYPSTSLHHNQLLNLFSSRSTLKTIDLGSMTSSSSSPFSSITSVCHHGHLFSPDRESADQLVRHPFAPSYSPVGHITHLFFIS